MKSVAEQLGLAEPPKQVDITQVNEAIARKRARALLLTAYQGRDSHRAAKPTTVRVKDSRGAVLTVFDDGSQRHGWKRMPGLSGRQFRNLRKQVNRKLRADARAQQMAQGE